MTDNGIDLNDSAALLKKANELRRVGDNDEALKFARKAVKADSKNGIAWMVIGAIEAKNSNVEEAIKAFMSAIDGDLNLMGSEPGARMGIVYEYLEMERELRRIRRELQNTGMMLAANVAEEWKQLIMKCSKEDLREWSTPEY